MVNDPRGNRIKELREARGLSMAELAALCSRATASQINKLEKGKTQLTSYWLDQLANALGVHRLEILEPVPKLSQTEQALIERYRGLNETGQQTVFKVADAMAQSTVTRREAEEHEGGADDGTDPDLEHAPVDRGRPHRRRGDRAE